MGSSPQRLAIVRAGGHDAALKDAEMHIAPGDDPRAAMARQPPAPSRAAASRRLGGSARNWLRIQNVPKATDWAICGSATAQIVSVSPSVRRSKNSGMTMASAGTINPRRNR